MQGNVISSGHTHCSPKRAPQFSGTLQITSKGFKTDAAPLLGGTVQSLEQFVKTQTPDDTVVFVNVHNTNKTLSDTAEGIRAFCSSAKGANRVHDLIVNLKVKGDRTRTCFGIDGEDLGQWLSKLESHIQSTLTQQKPRLIGVVAEFQNEHDTPWDKLKPKTAQTQLETGVTVSKRIRKKAGRHLRSKWTSKRSKTISGTLLRLVKDKASSGVTNTELNLSSHAIALAGRYVATLSPRNPAKALAAALLRHVQAQKMAKS
jgi:hypothetical protein